MKQIKQMCYIMFFCLFGFLLTGCQKEEEPVSTETTYETFEETVSGVNTTIHSEDGEEMPLQLNLWYTDKSSAAYYESAATDFHERYGVEIICTYKDEVNFLESVNEANLTGEGPDIFIASNDDVRKMRLAGLTGENVLYTDEFWNQYFPEVTKAAMTSDGKQYGYPIYMDTCMMIYDSSLTSQPETFGSITDFAVNFTDETNSKVIFHWNIADPFCDYIFLGTNAEILGDYGEDTTVFDINNEKVMESMTYYQSLHEYFSMDVDNSSYEQIKSELSNGNLVYGIVKTDVLGEMNSYGSTYALCRIPDLSADLPVQNLSVTYGAFVNPFTEHSEYANLFGAYLSYEYAGNQFGLSQKVSVCSAVNRIDSNESLAFEQYCNSVSVPKALENGDFWIYTEICFKNIWNGNDVTSELNTLQEKMVERLN